MDILEGDSEKTRALRRASRRFISRYILVKRTRLAFTRRLRRTSARFSWRSDTSTSWSMLANCSLLRVSYQLDHLDELLFYDGLPERHRSSSSGHSRSLLDGFAIESLRLLKALPGRISFGGASATGVSMIGKLMLNSEKTPD